MFDIGFSELIVVFIVGLLILGPERLPQTAKTVGLWVRKIRRSLNAIQREINMQLDQEELQRKLNDGNQKIMKETQAIQNTITPLPEPDLSEPKELLEPKEVPSKSSEEPSSSNETKATPSSTTQD